MQKVITCIKFNKVIAAPKLLYGLECWVPTKKQQQRIQPAETKFLCTLIQVRLIDKLPNQEMRSSLELFDLT